MYINGTYISSGPLCPSFLFGQPPTSTQVSLLSSLFFLIDRYSYFVIMGYLKTLAALASVASIVSGQSTFSPVRPPAIPLAGMFMLHLSSIRIIY